MDELGAEWVRSLTAEQKQLLRDHAKDPKAPQVVRELLAEGPFAVIYMKWDQTGGDWSVFMSDHITDNL